MPRSAMMLMLAGAAGCVPHLESKNGGATIDWTPPTNSWPMAAPPEDATCGGLDVGSTPCDVRLGDQFGDEVSLWQFWGSVIVLDISTMWCGPCQELATHTEELYQEHLDVGFMYLTVLQENVSSQPPSIDELNQWVDSFDITAPVLDDGDKELVGAVKNGSYPAVLVIDRDMVIRERVTPPEDALLRAAVESLL